MISVMVPEFALDFLETAARSEPGGSPDPSLIFGWWEGKCFLALLLEMDFGDSRSELHKSLQITKECCFNFFPCWHKWTSFVQTKLINAFFKWKWKTLGCCPLSTLFYFVLQGHTTFSFSSLTENCFPSAALEMVFSSSLSFFQLLWTHHEKCFKNYAKKWAQLSVPFPTAGHWVCDQWQQSSWSELLSSI